MVWYCSYQCVLTMIICYESQIYTMYDTVPFEHKLSWFCFGLTILCSIFKDSIIVMPKFRASLWYHVRNHGSRQWYDIVHFEHKLSWLCFGLSQKTSYQWRCISLLINPWSFSKLTNVRLTLNNPLLEQSTPCSQFFVLYLRILLSSWLSLGHDSYTIIAKFRAWLLYDHG